MNGEVLSKSGATFKDAFPVILNIVRCAPPSKERRQGNAPNDAVYSRQEKTQEKTGGFSRPQLAQPETRQNKSACQPGRREDESIERHKTGRKMYEKKYRALKQKQESIVQQSEKNDPTRKPPHAGTVAPEPASINVVLAHVERRQMIAGSTGAARFSDLPRRVIYV